MKLLVNFLIYILDIKYKKGSTIMQTIYDSIGIKSMRSVTREEMAKIYDHTVKQYVPIAPKGITDLKCGKCRHGRSLGNDRVYCDLNGQVTRSHWTATVDCEE